MTEAWQSVASDRYLAEALELTADERNRLATVLNQLPDVVRDAHTHMADRSEVTADFPEPLMLHPVSSYPAYGYPDATAARRALWPGKRAGALRMPHAFRGFDYRAINTRLSNETRSHGDVPALYGLPDDIEYTVEQLRSGSAAALKMYYAYRDPPFTTIDEIFPRDVLRVAEAESVPIILHLPSPLPNNLAELVELASAYPRLPIVLAHLGGHGAHFYAEEAAEALRTLGELPNIFGDTALVFDRALIEAALLALGPDRVLFGTDEPLSLIRVVSYRHERLGPRFYAPHYHWAQEEGAPSDVRGRSPELLHLLQIEAVAGACRALRAEAVVEAVFRDNADRLYRFDS